MHNNVLPFSKTQQLYNVEKVDQQMKEEYIT